MKNLSYTLKAIPPYVLFLLGFGSVVAFACVKALQLLEKVA